MITKTFDFIVKYEVVFNLAINVLLVWIGFQGLDKIKQYQIRKNTDHKYNLELSIFEKKQDQLSQLIVALSEVKVSFMNFNNEYGDAKYDQSFKLDKIEMLINNMRVLEGVYILYSKVIIQAYLMNSKLEEECMSSRFLLGEYIYAYKKILCYLQKEKLIPSEFDKEDEFFKDHTMLLSSNTEIIFQKMGNVENLIIESSNNTRKESTIYQ